MSDVVIVRNRLNDDFGAIYVLESVWRAVPMIIAFFFYFYGFFSKYEQIQTYNDTKDKLRKLLEDSKYKTNMKKMSASVRDYRKRPFDHAI